MEYGDHCIGAINFVSAFTKVVPEFLGPATPAVRKMVSENLAENIENTLSFLKFSTVKALPPDELEMMVAYNMVVPAKIRSHLLARPAPYEDGLKKIKVRSGDPRPGRPGGAHTHGSLHHRGWFHARSSFYGASDMPFWEDTPRATASSPGLSRNQ
jgi:hypothetical protein